MNVNETDATNPVAVIEKGWTRAEIPLSTNVMKVYFAGSLVLP